MNKLLAKVNNYSWGFTSGLIAFVLVYLFFKLDIHPDLPYSALIYGSVFEELIKVSVGLAAVHLGVHGLAVGMVGLGFGFAEQLYHFTFPWGDAVLPTFWMHALTGVGIGWFLHVYSKQNIRRYIFYAYLSALVVHGSYNAYLYYLISTIT